MGHKPLLLNAHMLMQLQEEYANCMHNSSQSIPCKHHVVVVIVIDYSYMCTIQQGLF